MTPKELAEEAARELRFVRHNIHFNADAAAIVERALDKLAEQMRKERSTSAVGRLHNLCDALRYDKEHSPYSVEAWDELTAENDNLRKQLAAQMRPTEGERWQGIHTAPMTDDLIWLMRGDSIEGPRPWEIDDPDRFDYWAPCEPPSPATDQPAQGETPRTELRLALLAWAHNEETKPDGSNKYLVELLRNAESALATCEARAYEAAKDAQRYEEVMDILVNGGAVRYDSGNMDWIVEDGRGNQSRCSGGLGVLLDERLAPAPVED